MVCDFFGRQDAWVEILRRGLLRMTELFLERLADLKFGHYMEPRNTNKSACATREISVGEWRRWNYGEEGRNSEEGRGIHHVGKQGCVCLELGAMQSRKPR